MNPTAEESYSVLGLTLSQQGLRPEAEQVLRDALALPGTSSYSRATLGYVLARAAGSGRKRLVSKPFGITSIFAAAKPRWP